MNTNVQGALHDLDAGRRASVAELFQDQDALLGTISDLEQKQQALVSAEKVGPISGALQSQQAELVTAYEEVNTTLKNITDELKTKKDTNMERLDRQLAEARKQSARIKQLLAEEVAASKNRTRY